MVEVFVDRDDLPDIPFHPTTIRMVVEAAKAKLEKQNPRKVGTKWEETVDCEGARYALVCRVIDGDRVQVRRMRQLQKKKAQPWAEE